MATPAALELCDKGGHGESAKASVGGGSGNADPCCQEIFRTGRILVPTKRGPQAQTEGRDAPDKPINLWHTAVGQGKRGGGTSRNRGLRAPHRRMQYQRTTVARRSYRQPRYGQDGNKRAGLVGAAHQCATNTQAEPKSSTTMWSRPLSAALRLNALRLKVPCAPTDVSYVWRPCSGRESSLQRCRHASGEPRARHSE